MKVKLIVVVAIHLLENIICGSTCTYECDYKDNWPSLLSKEGSIIQVHFSIITKVIKYYRKKF